VIFERRHEDVSVHGVIDADQTGGVHIVTDAWTRSPSGNVQTGAPRQWQRPTSTVTTTAEAPMFCRRDDWAFIPVNAQGGLPCVAPTRDANIDPEEFARQLAQTVPLPNIELHMNPELGLTQLPTWFWVEGYDGAVFGRAEPLFLVKRSCTLKVERDERGDLLLDAQQQPQVREECTTTTNTVHVEVRLWPKQYSWDFGDKHAQPVACDGISSCTGGLGLPYTDARHPSPIQHTYVWTSIDQGSDDAYRVGLGMVFGAQFRIGFNDAPFGSWSDVPDRVGAWSRGHQVQQVQAVLSRP
jgi:hypothetical protein